MTEGGVKEQEVLLHAKNVIECTHIGEEAVKNARSSFDTPFDPLYSNDEQFVTNDRGLVKGCAGDVAAEDSTPQQETPTGSALREIHAS